MLTLLDSLSVAGDRGKQNDDCAGAHGRFAWVIDGATDLHDAPFAPAATDAAWLAQELNADLAAGAAGADSSEAGLRALLRDASEAAAGLFSVFAGKRAVPPWARPIASALIAAETESGLAGIDLGDCRLFAVDAAGAWLETGGPPAAADAEAQRAAAARDAHAPATGELYRSAPVLDLLRAQRAGQNADPNHQVFSLDPGCADRARFWTHSLARPAFVLLATDGFAALADRYGLYTPQTLIAAAREKGLYALAAELRAIEQADASGAKHPRYKKSDDATALLLRLS